MENNIQDAESVAQSCLEVYDHIKTIRTRLGREETRKEQRLKELKAEFPSLLIRAELGENSNGAVVNAKAEIVDLEHFLEDLPLKLQGLEQRDRENDRKLAEALKVLRFHRAREQYQEKLAEIQVNYTKKLESDLRHLAHELNLVSETEPVLREANAQRSQ